MDLFLFLRSDGEFILHADHRAVWGEVWGRGLGGVCISLEGWQSLLTLWEWTSYRPRKLISISRGRLKHGISRPLWYLSRSLAHVCAPTHVHACAQTRTHHLIISHLLILIMSPHRLLSQSLMFIRTWEKLRWYSFFFKTQKQPKAKKKKKKCGTSKPLWWWVHINEHITHKHIRNVLEIIHILLQVKLQRGLWISMFEHKKILACRCVCAAQAHTNASHFASTNSQYHRGWLVWEVGMNTGEGLSRATHETWRGCQSILFPSCSLDLTRASGCSVCF